MSQPPQQTFADLTMYWGVAGGSTHAAFRRHYEGLPEYQDGPTPTHIMVNWQTDNNEVWGKREWDGPRWMIDSGGAPKSIIKNRGHVGTIEDYLDYIEDPPIKYGDDPDEVQIDQFALRDWPCEPSVRNALDLSVEELQRRTLIDHINMMDAYERRNLDIQPVAVLQGWSVADYLNHLDMLRDHGLLTDTVAIGTLCGRDQPQVIRTTAWRIARNLPGRVDLHGFGVKQSALQQPDILRIFESLDTLAWDQNIYYDARNLGSRGPPGLPYDAWIDWNDEGLPRYTARNLWLNYRQYARRMAGVEPVETARNVRVVTLDQLYDLSEAEPPPGHRADEYIVYKCLCDQIVDPGRPDPTIGSPQCRHCERLELDILNRRIQLEDRIRAGDFPTYESPSLAELRATIQDQLGGP